MLGTYVSPLPHYCCCACMPRACRAQSKKWHTRTHYGSIVATADTRIQPTTQNTTISRGEYTNQYLPVLPASWWGAGHIPAAWCQDHTFLLVASSAWRHCCCHYQHQTVILKEISYCTGQHHVRKAERQVCPHLLLLLTCQQPHPIQHAYWWRHQPLQHTIQTSLMQRSCCTRA